MNPCPKSNLNLNQIPERCKNLVSMCPHAACSALVLEEANMHGWILLDKNILNEFEEHWDHALFLSLRISCLRRQSLVTPVFFAVDIGCLRGDDANYRNQDRKI